jgi:hypothetical protein
MTARDFAATEVGGSARRRLAVRRLAGLLAALAALGSAGASRIVHDVQAAPPSWADTVHALLGVSATVLTSHLEPGASLSLRQGTRTVANGCGLGGTLSLGSGARRLIGESEAAVDPLTCRFLVEHWDSPWHATTPSAASTFKRNGQANVNLPVWPGPNYTATGGGSSPIAWWAAHGSSYFVYPPDCTGNFGTDCVAIFGQWPTETDGGVFVNNWVADAWDGTCANSSSNYHNTGYGAGASYSYYWDLNAGWSLSDNTWSSHIGCDSVSSSSYVHFVKGSGTCKDMNAYFNYNTVTGHPNGSITFTYYDTLAGPTVCPDLGRFSHVFTPQTANL